MKNIILLILTIFITASVVIAEPVAYRRKNTATRFCGTLLDITTARQINVAATGITCQYTSYTAGSDEAVFTNFTTAESVVGSGGAFCQVILAGEINIDGYLRVYCAATGIANSAAYEMTFTTLKTDIADGGIGSLTQSFDGQTLAEGTNTIDLEASEVSVDGQFVGDKIALFHQSDGQYYGSSCITGSTNANERITTKDNLAPLHTVGDYYLLVPDAGCTVAQNLLATAMPEVSAVPTPGTETFADKLNLIFQRLVYRVVDDNNTLQRKWYKANGSTQLGKQTLTKASNVFGTNGLTP